MIRRLLLLSTLAYVYITVKKAVSQQREARKTADSLAHGKWESEGGPAPPAESVAPVG